MKSNLWHSLEILSTQAALLKEWQEELGKDFEAARPFLRPTQQQAESYPCSHANACGCRHRVVTQPIEYSLSEEEKAAHAGKLQDKIVHLGIREFSIFGTKLRARGRIVGVVTG
jgi:hypothetical protein